MGATMLEAPSTHVTPVDFRRPSRISRDAVVALESMHEAFSRRLATAWSASGYTVVEVEHVSTDQLSLDDFVRSLPVPTALGTMRVDRIGAAAFVQVDLPLSLLFIERVMGGAGDPGPAPVSRRPTDLEQALLTQEVFGPALQAVDEALRDLEGEPTELTGFDTAPQPIQLGSPGELLLLLTYRTEVRDEHPAQGLVTLAYPVAPLVSRLEHLLNGHGAEPDEEEERPSPIRERLLDAPVDLRVRIGGSSLPASLVADLQAGDVLRLDHAADRPADLVVDDRVVGTAHLGRRRRRVAVQIVDPPTVPGTRSLVGPTTEATAVPAAS